MRLFLKSSLIVLTACGSVSSGACANSEPATNTSPSLETVTTLDDHHDHSHEHDSDQDPQVLISGLYHLEFIPEPTNGGINLDFHLETEVSHEVITDAKVTASVLSPTGDQYTLDLLYEADGEHYIAFLPAPVTGTYTVTFLVDVNGEQVSGQFSFDQ